MKHVNSDSVKGKFEDVGKVEHNSDVFHHHAGCQNKGQCMLLSSESVQLNWNQKRVHYEERQVDFKDVMLLERELVLEWIYVLCSRISIYKPQIILQFCVLLVVVPGAVLCYRIVVVARHKAGVPESETRKRVKFLFRFLDRVDQKSKHTLILIAREHICGHPRKGGDSCEHALGVKC